MGPVTLEFLVGTLLLLVASALRLTPGAYGAQGLLGWFVRLLWFQAWVLLFIEAYRWPDAVRAVACLLAALAPMGAAVGIRSGSA